jgi:hypothetical protein
MTANLTEGDITTMVLTGVIVAVVPVGVAGVAVVRAGPVARAVPDVKDTTTPVVKDTTTPVVKDTMNHVYR